MREKRTHSWLLLGHLSFAVLFILSILFYKERILFADSAFQFFKIVNFEKINIEASRYGAILPQLPVLLAIKLGVNLKWLTLIYSTSFILLYYIVFNICTYLLKNIVGGLAIVLTLILCISQSFFHPVTETHQSLVFSVLLYSILEYKGFRHTIFQYSLAVFVIAISFFAHPIALFPTIFIIGYVIIDNNQIKSLKPYLLFIFIGILAVCKISLTKENSYEGNFFSQLLNSPSLIFNIQKAYSTHFLLNRIDGLYLGLTLLEILLVIIFTLKKQWKKLIWQFVSVLSFLLITLLTYYNGDSEILMERAFMPLALFISIPFLVEIWQNFKKQMVFKTIILSIVIFISINRIVNQGRQFQTRTEFNKELLAKTAHFPNRKFIIDESELSQHAITFWSNSFESLILSTITEDIPSQTIYATQNSDQLSKYTKEPNLFFLGADFWLEWKIEDLNAKYFSLPTDLPYKKINIENYIDTCIKGNQQSSKF